MIRAGKWRRKTWSVGCQLRLFIKRERWNLWPYRVPLTPATVLPIIPEAYHRFLVTAELFRAAVVNVASSLSSYFISQINWINNQFGSVRFSRRQQCPWWIRQLYGAIPLFDKLMISTLCVWNLLTSQVLLIDVAINKGLIDYGQPVGRPSRSKVMSEWIQLSAAVQLWATTLIE